MLDVLPGIITSLAVCVSFVSIFWIRRTTENFSTIHGLGAALMFAFTLWHWYNYSVNPHTAANEIILGLFLIGITCANVLAASATKTNNGSTLNRRADDRRKNVIKINDERRGHKDRRKSATMKQTKLKTGNIK